jgi:hypothetical protein
MKKFRVVASYVTYCTTEIEAENADDAYNISLNMSGSDFDSDETKEELSIDEIQDITEEASCAQ